MSRTYRDCNLYWKFLCSQDRPYLASMDKKTYWWDHYAKKSRNKEIRRNNKFAIDEYMNEEYDDFVPEIYFDCLVIEYSLYKK